MVDGLAAGVLLLVLLLDESDDVLVEAVVLDELVSPVLVEVDELLLDEPPRLSVL